MAPAREFVKFGDCRGNWKRRRRAIFCRLVCEQRQYLMEFVRLDTVLYTNLQRFAPNAAFYYTMFVVFFLYETFKEDMCIPVVKVTSYATTLRRRVIDIAAKVVQYAREITLKVTRATWKGLNFAEVWRRSGAPPPQFVWA